MDSLERASDALPTLEGAAQDASREACASLEDGALARGPPKDDQAVSEAFAAETTICLPLHAKWSSLIIPSSRRVRLLDRLMLGSYVKPIEWGRPSVEPL